MIKISKARKSTHAIERLYISMRHLFYRGFFKPGGASGEELRKLLLDLEPEIYGSIKDPNKVEINGLLYVLDRLPEGIAECPYVHLISDEGLNRTSFTPIVPKKRRRNCYRIDEFQMNIEILLGRSEIYDILTHLTFLYMEADKIASKAYDGEGNPTRIWNNVENYLQNASNYSKKEMDVLMVHLADLLGRSIDEVMEGYENFKEENDPDRFLRVIYHLGRVSHEEKMGIRSREIHFSSILRERVGHHIFGEKWAVNIKQLLLKKKLHKQPLHIISANMHSVMNMLFAFDALGQKYAPTNEFKVYESLSNDAELRKKVLDFAIGKGMIYVKDTSGSNIDVQIFDTSKISFSNTPFQSLKIKENSVILVFDYAFGEQAYEVMDELLKPNKENEYFELNVHSISIMGKAGILVGDKGDIMIPTAHVFEGTADNYPFENALTPDMFQDDEIKSFKGTMITVLGTSLQNKDLLSYFMTTSWGAIGLEMEGAHYQKAIQVASKIRKHIQDNVVLRYAYYASDNPLETGSTLASGGLGLTGVKPTYMITSAILSQILTS